MPLVRSLPENATLSDLRGQYADLLELFRPYGERLMRGPSPFTPAERELIAAYVSSVNGCRFCFNVHSRPEQGGDAGSGDSRRGLEKAGGKERTQKG